MGEGAVCVERSTDPTELKTGPAPELFDTKKEAKEVCNEDIKSEVSNPIVSPKENATSCQDITSQPADVALGNRVAFSSGEVISGCSSPMETLSEEGEEPSSGNSNSQSGTPPGGPDDCSNSVYTSRFVLEIPKHVSSTGIRKITFKFSKRKDDYDTQMATSATEPVSNEFGQGLCYTEEPGKEFSTWVDSGRVMPECRDRYLSLPRKEIKLSKKVVAADVPTNVKKLLSTGILDGARVKYVSFSPERELVGIIGGGGYLCGCSSCNFSNVLTAYEFEQHAGAKTRHPNNHIYLENGKPIYNIIQELKTAPLSLMDEVIKDVAGSSINEEYFQIWKASLQQNDGDFMENEKSFSRPSQEQQSLVSYSSHTLEENIYPTPDCFLTSSLARHQTFMDKLSKQKRGLKRPCSYTCGSVVKQKKAVEGGTKKRDNDLHRLLFMPNGLPDGTELAYYVKGQNLLKGRKQGNGILCVCCKTEVSPSQFEAHAGMAARRQPYRHIYTNDGLTLHDIAISLANGQSLVAGASDDMCTKCGDGGDLIFCQNCPRAFHPACVDLESIPEGAWYCPNCKIHGVNSAGPIILRLSRVVKAPEYVGGCVICRIGDFSTGMFDDRTVILCDQCEKEFHVGCLRETGVCDLKELPRDNWFCCDDCSGIYVALQNFVSKGLQEVATSHISIISRKHADKGVYMDGNPSDVQWRILLGKSRDVEHLALLSRVSAIFRECFNPIIAKSGRDLIPVMVHGRNISGQEFSSMYCVLLIVREDVVSAGLLRVFGRDVAELPLVATSREHQGKGYFQALFSCIESLLFSLNVQNLVLPAAEEAESIWTRRFGFRKMSEQQLAKYTSEFQLTIFKGTSMLERAVPQRSE